VKERHNNAVTWFQQHDFSGVRRKSVAPVFSGVRTGKMQACCDFFDTLIGALEAKHKHGQNVKTHNTSKIANTAF